MSTVAEQLRQAREAKSLSIQQVADITKIRTDHLRALEEGDFDVFAAPVYIRGFVRTYSGILKLDVAQTMAALDGELAQTKKFAEPPALTDHPRGVVDFLMLQLSKVAWRKGLLALAGAVVVLAVVLGYLVVKHRHAAKPMQGVKPAVYHSAQTSASESLPVPGQKR